MANFYYRMQSIASEYPTDDIFIVGKGRSLDGIDIELIRNSVVININDSCKILPGTLCVYHRSWVWESLKNFPFARTMLHITDLELEPSFEYVQLPYVPDSLKNREVITHWYFEKETYIIDPLFVTCIKIARILSEIKERKQRVFFIGLDFDFASEAEIYSNKIDKDYSQDKLDLKKAVLHEQEHIFYQYMHMLRSSNDLALFHIGYRSYSSFSPEEFNTRLGEQYNVTGFHAEKIPHRVRVVAEFTNNHQGDCELLRDMIWSAKDCGADFIKIQKRDVESFYTRVELESYYHSPFGTTLKDYRLGVELSSSCLEMLTEECKKASIGWGVSVLDYKSFSAILKYEPDYIKIPSTISEHTEFHKRVAEEYSGPIAISTGLTDKYYERHIFDLFSRNSILYLLQCTSSYPAPENECQIAVVRHYAKLVDKFPNVVAGYSSHDVGVFCSALAVACGALMIEKHVKMEDTPWIHFDKVALRLKNNEFKQYVDEVRRTERVVGSEDKIIHQSETHKYPLLPSNT